MAIQTARTRLRPWCEQDRDALAHMHADSEVMADYGGPLDRAESDAKLDRYRAAYDAHGFGRWLLEDLGGEFLGYVGVMPIGTDHPAAPGVEIGWRLVRSAWGHGYASEAARAVLLDGFVRNGWTEVVAYTAADNVRSQAVMDRLGLVREAHRDFTAGYGDTSWHGLVWVAHRDRWR